MAEVTTKAVEVGRKYDRGKLDWSILSLDTLAALARVMKLGEQKYGRANYLHVENGEDRYYSALMRHLKEHRDGANVDEESGEDPLVHVMACALILYERGKHATGG